MPNSERIGSRIRLLLLSLSLATSGFFILVLLSYSWVVEDNIFNRQVADEARYIEAGFIQDQQVRSPRFPFMQLYADWGELPDSVQRQRAQSADRVEFPLAGGGTLHLTTLTLGQDQWILAADVTAYEVSKEYLPRIIPWMLAAVLGISLISYAISRYLNRYIVKPIVGITDALKSHSADEPLTVARHFSDNEIGYLATSIESTVNRLRQAVNRESQFTRDISHELRTPTAVLAAIAEQYDGDSPLPSASTLRFKQAVKQLQQNLEVLLALAREESLVTEVLNLRGEIESCIINHSVLANDDQFELSFDVDASITVAANSNLLRILISNLLDNAVVHGSEKRLLINSTDQGLLIANPGRGMPDENVFSSQVKGGGSPGLGHGLHLVQRICRQMNWHARAGLDSDYFRIQIIFRPEDDAQPTDSNRGLGTTGGQVEARNS